jgi:hypothetical protein
MSTMKIGNLELKLPSPYAPGHVCTPQEAAVLNRELHTRLRENIARRVAPFVLSDEVAEYQMDLQHYIRSFSLNGHDTLDRMSQDLALELVKHQIKASGKALRDYTKAALRTEAEKVLKGPKAVEIRALAKRRIAFIQEAATEEVERRLG